MKKALVLGITGGFGGHVARALLASGWHVTALVRSPKRLAEDFRQLPSSQLTVVTASATESASLIKHGQGCSVLVYGLNPAYKDWQHSSLAWLNESLAAAKALDARLVFPANVYNFNPRLTPVIDEQSPIEPVDHKGHIRVAQEQAIAAYGGKSLLVRTGDYVAKDAPSAWFNMLIKPSKVVATTDPSTPHAWAYLPDVGNTVAKLLATTLEDNAVYHFAGHYVSFQAWQQALNGAKLSKFPWWAIKLIAPFSPNLREVLSMRYLWQHPLRLSNRKLVDKIGTEPHTPLATILDQELALTTNRIAEQP